MDGRLSGAQAELALQEDSVRRSERERRAALDQVAALERSLQATESELRASQVGGQLRAGGGGGGSPYARTAVWESYRVPLCRCLPVLWPPLT